MARTSPAGCGRSAIDQFEECAVLAPRLVLFIEHGQVAFLELGELAVPADVLQPIVVCAAGDVDPQHASAVAVSRVAHTGRLAIVLVDPASNLVVMVSQQA